jgi:hypothetical protein
MISFMWASWAGTKAKGVALPFARSFLCERMVEQLFWSSYVPRATCRLSHYGLKPKAFLFAALVVFVLNEDYNF